MFEKLKVLAARLDELEMRLSAPDLYDDPDRAAKLLRERNELEPIVTAFREYEQAQRTLADATEMLSDPDMKELAQEELQQAKADIARLEDELKLLLLPIVVGISYEFNRLVGRHDNWLTRALSAPGMWLQNWTTFEPDDSMIEVGIRAFTLVLPEEKGKDQW